MINGKKESLSEDIYLRFIEKVNSFIGKEISKFGIGSGQNSVSECNYIKKTEYAVKKELAENLHIDKGTTCRAIKKLEEEELLRLGLKMKMTKGLISYI